MANECIHHWDIDSLDIGRCRKCGEARDFGALLYKQSRVAISLAKRKSALKRWKDLDYREKQTAAHKEYWKQQRAARGSQMVARTNVLLTTVL